MNLRPGWLNAVEMLSEVRAALHREWAADLNFSHASDARDVLTRSHAFMALDAAMDQFRRELGLPLEPAARASEARPARPTPGPDPKLEAILEDWRTNPGTFTVHATERDE